MNARSAMSAFEGYWRERAQAAQEPREVESTEVGITTPIASYRALAYPALDGTVVRARAVLPRAAGPRPCIVVFHDMDRGARGWHHLTRYTAAGFAVLHVQTRPQVRDLTAGWEEGPQGMAFARLTEDALVSAAVAAGLSGVDPTRLVAYGEGLGGALAVEAAALMPGFAKAAALNPMPAAPRLAWEAGAHEFAYAGLVRHFRDEDPASERADELFGALTYVDAAEFAALLPAQTEYLQGTCLMDTVAPPATQRALFEAATCTKKLVEYPKYAHERLNDFENRLFDFLHFD